MLRFNQHFSYRATSQLFTTLIRSQSTTPSSSVDLASATTTTTPKPTTSTAASTSTAAALIQKAQQYKFNVIQTNKNNASAEQQVLYPLKTTIEAIKAYNLTPRAQATGDVYLNLQIHLLEANGRFHDPIRVDFALPHGLAQKQKILVFAEGPVVSKLKAAGADFVGGPEIFPQVVSGEIKFDRVLSTTAMLKHIKNIVKELKAHTPTQKRGTVADDDALVELVGKLRSGMQAASDKVGFVRVKIGKSSTPAQKLYENALAVVKAFRLATPDSKPITEISVGGNNFLGLFPVTIEDTLNTAMGEKIVQSAPIKVRVKKTVTKKAVKKVKKE